MYKIFMVQKGTKVEEEVEKLVYSGSKYMTTFENQIGILDFCIDLEILSDGIVNPNLYIVIKGFSDELHYENENLIEITKDQLSSTCKQGYSILASGTNRLINELGYKIIPYNGYLNKIERIHRPITMQR